jgi:ubiquitin carboxyl-terminal hydrolase 16/45
VKCDETRVLYALYGVVEHSGRLTGGHYTAYVKVRPHNTQLGQFLNRQDTNNVRLDKILETLHQHQHSEGSRPPEGSEEMMAPPGKWYYISDSRVTEANETSVLRCQAYILFYERIL